jgi:anaerobic selenocysteine-containing dehydrogenase
MPTTEHLRTCPRCEAMCGLRIHVEDGRVTRIRPNPDDVCSRCAGDIYGALALVHGDVRALERDPLIARRPRDVEGRRDRYARAPAADGLRC